jgi:hypothetical protein
MSNRVMAISSQFGKRDAARGKRASGRGVVEEFALIIILAGGTGLMSAFLAAHWLPFVVAQVSAMLGHGVV